MKPKGQCCFYFARQDSAKLPRVKGEEDLARGIRLVENLDVPGYDFADNVKSLEAMRNNADFEDL